MEKHQGWNSLEDGVWIIRNNLWFRLWKFNFWFLFRVVGGWKTVKTYLLVILVSTKVQIFGFSDLRLLIWLWSWQNSCVFFVLLNFSYKMRYQILSRVKVETFVIIKYVYLYHFQQKYLYIIFFHKKSRKKYFSLALAWWWLINYWF